MKRDVASGTLLIAGALAGVLIMLLHPTGTEVQAATPGHGMALVNVLVHGSALVATPVIFLGLLGLARALGFSGLTTAALVAWGYGAVAVMSAAVASGFVTPAAMDMPEALAHYSYMWNQAYARVNVVATGLSMLLWSWAMLKSRAVGLGPIIWGSVVGLAVVAGVLSGHLRLNLHGFGMVVIGQSVWLVWLGILLCRRPAQPEGQRAELGAQ